MANRQLAFPERYDRRTQYVVGLFAIQLDDQLDLLKEAVKNLTPLQLEWQLRPGMNTVGMLLAHLAVVEVFWINVAAKEMNPDTDGERLMKSTIGINMDDDGLPAKPESTHPGTLKGKSIAEYITMLDQARVSVHSELLKWKDADLDGTFIRKRGETETNVSRMWTLYHVLEHFAGHFGQILLLKHMMKDAGILTK